MREFLLKNQQKIAIICGYTVVFLLALGLGRITVYLPSPPEIKVEESQNVPQQNNSASVEGTQSVNTALQKQGGAGNVLNCEGKIKGNISSTGRIYHVPGGAFYKNTAPEMCFDTEADALASGFRKSKR
jgi:micrococcal nuclease